MALTFTLQRILNSIINFSLRGHPQQPYCLFNPNCSAQSVNPSFSLLSYHYLFICVLDSVSYWNGSDLRARFLSLLYLGN